MLYRCLSVGVVAVAALALGCADRTPTSPTLDQSSEATLAATRKPGKHTGSLTAAIDQTISATRIIGTVQITKLTQDAAGQLLASGILSGTANGVAISQAFSNVAAKLSSGSATSSKVASTATIGIMQAGAPVTAAASAADACDVLFLDLGPLNLDLLGLTVDLSEVVLDVNAVTGSGNLLGNLLCAVLRLLDGPAILSAVSNLLDQINAILGAV